MKVFAYLIILLPFTLFAQFDEPADQGLLTDGKNKITKNAAGQYGVISENGNTLIPFVYSKIIENPWGLIVFKINKNNGFERSYSLGFYNHQFKFVLPCQFNSLLPIDDGFIIASQNKDKLYGLVDTLGQIIIPFEYEELHAPTDDLYLAKQEGKYGFINRRNHKTVDFEFNYAAPYSEELAAASKSQQIGYINRKGNWVISEQFSAADEFHHGFAQVFLHSQATVIDLTGKILFPALFKSIKSAGNNQFIFEAGENTRAQLPELLQKLPIVVKPDDISVYDTLIVSTDSDMEFEGQENHFMGVLNLQGQLIGGNEFQQVILIDSEGDKQLYAVQRKVDSEDDPSNYLFALMNEAGQLITTYRFFDVKPDEKQVLEENDTDYKTFSVNIDGTLKLVK